VVRQNCYKKFYFDKCNVMHAGMQHVSQKENIWYVWAISINVSYEVKKLSGSYYAYVGPHLEIALKPDNLVMTDCWLLR